jgi:prepilin-type N-terminal cleavage/methylation domain-containing protein
MTRKRGFTLVELLVVIAIIAVLLAVLLPSLANVKNIARRVQCGTRLKGIANATTFYADKYDGLLPRPENNPDGNKNYANWHYFTAKRDGATTPGTGYFWLNLGCLFGAGLVDDGRLFYCPATEGWYDDYKQYNSSGPWGDLPQYLPGTTTPIPANVGNQWLRTKKGYVWAPQSKEVIKTAAELSSYGNAGVNYSVNFPKYATKLVDLNQGKAISTDLTFHQVKGSGWNSEAAFPDGHVTLQAQPKNAAGLGRYFDYSQFPDSIVTNSGGTVTWWDTAEQARNSVGPTTLAEYMFTLQP